MEPTLTYTRGLVQIRVFIYNQFNTKKCSPPISLQKPTATRSRSEDETGYDNPWSRYTRTICRPVARNETRRALILTIPIAPPRGANLCRAQAPSFETDIEVEEIDVWPAE